MATDPLDEFFGRLFGREARRHDGSVIAGPIGIVQPKDEHLITDLQARVRNRLRVYDYVLANAPERGA